MRYVLVGSVESSALALEEMVAAGLDLAAVVTLRSHLAHRHSDFVDLEPLAKSAKVPVRQVKRLNDAEELAWLKMVAPDYLCVIGWSELLGRDLLQIPTHGCIGFHPSLLPQFRGRAVLAWTILQGLRRSGCSLFFLDEGVDSGDILVQHPFEVAEDETVRTLMDKALAALREMLREAIPLLESGQPRRQPQNHIQASYCARRTPRDGVINWMDAAEAIWRQIRALSRPYPGAFTHRRGRRLTVWEANYVGKAAYVGLPGQIQAVASDGVIVQCGDGEHLCLRVVEPEQQGPQPASDCLTITHERLGLDWLNLYEELRERMET